MHHRGDHLSERCGEELSWLADDIFGDALSKQEVSACVCEMVAIMLKHVVSFHTPLALIFPQELHE